MNHTNLGRRVDKVFSSDGKLVWLGSYTLRTKDKKNKSLYLAKSSNTKG